MVFLENLSLSKEILFYHYIFLMSFELKLNCERIHMFLDIIKYNHSKLITKISEYIHDPNNIFKERINTRQDCTYKEYQFYTDIHPSFSGEFIWIPKGDDYFGINDRHAIVNSKFIKINKNTLIYLDTV